MWKPVDIDIELYFSFQAWCTSWRPAKCQSSGSSNSGSSNCSGIIFASVCAVARLNGLLRRRSHLMVGQTLALWSSWTIQLVTKKIAILCWKILPPRLRAEKRYIHVVHTMDYTVHS